MAQIRVTFWNEYRHEKTDENAKALYPNGIHAFVKSFLEKDADITVRLAALDDPDNGLTDEILDDTDVLIWWGHLAHKEVPDALAVNIRNRVMDGKMGFIGLHSAHESKPFKLIVGTKGKLSWGRGQKEIVWNLMPSHPIAAGIPDHFLLEKEELYAEPFYIPQPDALVFASWYEDGFLFRSGACFLRGAGKVFYFQPGHETYKSFYNPYVQRIIQNAVHWAVCKPSFATPEKCPHVLTKIVDEFEAK